MMPKELPLPLSEDRRATQELLEEAKEAATEGARVAERLRLATVQYRARLGQPPGKREPKH